ncbi:MAG: flavoprotein [Elusimicrobiales bacterium]
MSKSKNILFQLSGSIACYKACSAISKLVQRGHEVKAVCTPAALKFIGEATLEGLTRKPVYCDMFERKTGLEHISLNKWADVSVVCPATADVISKMAAGIGDDCVTTLFLSHDFKKPFLVAPAMNVNMWNHPATRRSVETLRQWGVKIIEPGAGYQACGDEGRGRLSEPEEIVSAAEAA